MQIPPIAVLSTWPTPNYNHFQTRGNANFIINVILFPVALILLFLRVYTRVKISKSFGLDDVLIVAAMIPTAGFFFLGLLVDLYFNIFRHTWDFSPPELSIQLKTNLIAECLFGLAFLLTKLSLLQLLRRILKRSTSKIRLTVLMAMGLVLAEGLVFVFTVIFQCRPVSAYWTLSINPQSCISERSNLLAADIINTITNSLVALIPIFLISSLNLPLRQLLIVSGLFALGFIVVIAGIFRTVMFYHLGSVFDKTWVAYYVWMASEIELYIGVIYTSILPTQPLFMKLFPSTYTRLLIPPQNVPINIAENDTYRASIITSPRPVRITTSHLPIWRQIQEECESPSRIAVEDEVLISYESRKRLSPRDERHLNNSVDLESGLARSHVHFSTTPEFGAGSKDSAVMSSKSANHIHPGMYDRYLATPTPPLHQTVSRRIQYLKAPQPKVVRISLDNPRIRNITPNDEWNASNSRIHSQTSISASLSSPKNVDIGKTRFNKDRMGNRKEGGRTDSVSSEDSAITNGSRIIGIGAVIEPLPPCPSSKSHSTSASPGVASRSGSNSKKREYGETLNHTNNFKAKARRQQTGPGSPRDLGPKNTKDDASAVPSARKYHIAELMEERARNRSVIRSRITSWRSSKASSLSSRQRRAIQQADEPRGDSPTLNHLDMRLIFQSIRNGLA